MRSTGVRVPTIAAVLATLLAFGGLVAAATWGEERLRLVAGLSAGGAAAMLALAAFLLRRQSAARRSRNRARVAGANVAVPAWADELEDEQLEDLLTALRLAERKAQAAAQSAVVARRRSTQSLTGMWQLISGAVAAEERMRARLVSDLHDTVVQRLILAVYAAEDENVDRDELHEQLQMAHEELREIMAFARPPELRQGTLGRAVAGLAQQLRMRYRLQVEWDWPAPAVELPEAIALTVYRFLQEALSNVGKHAGVDYAEAGLAIDDDDVTAWVQDGGAGFEDTPRTGHHLGGQHIGLELMRERAAQLGARVEICSTPGQGTRATLRMNRAVGRGDRPVPAGEVQMTSTRLSLS